MGVTVILPVKNERMHIARCVQSVLSFADRVYVVDSGSDDGTVEWVQRLGSTKIELVHHEYQGPADQKNWALDHLDISTPWVLFLDADEWVPEELAEEIVAATREPSKAVRGYFLNRRIVWEGRWIRHGGWFPSWNLRLFQHCFGRYEQRRVHEHVVVNGPVQFMKAHLIHEDLRDLSHAIAKHNRYSSDEAVEYQRCLEGEPDPYARWWTRDALARRRWIKTKIWAPLPGKALWYFLWCYFVRAGFLDGRVGFRYHLLHAMFKHFDELKLGELRRGTRQLERSADESPRAQERETARA